jgi:putative AdoMet-dependent methyltransferase
MADLFPADDFDGWAVHYDQSVLNTQSFPFTGYKTVLDKVVKLTDAQPGMSILDLGTGTGNLAVRFEIMGCEVWGTDFSPAMLDKARLKLSHAHLFQVDLRGIWPPEMNRRFDHIVSAYVFHHFEFALKAQLIKKLVNQHLMSGGRLLLADIAFESQAALEVVKRSAGDEWEDEFYWLADETVSELAEANLRAVFYKISPCGGIFEITEPV